MEFLLGLAAGGMIGFAIGVGYCCAMADKLVKNRLPR